MHPRLAVLDRDRLVAIQGLAGRSALNIGGILAACAIVISLGLGIFVVGTLADEKTWVATQRPVGALGANETVFGVSIGMERSATARLLQERGFSYSETVNGGACLTEQTGAEVEVYYDFGWRRGTLCVSIVEQKLAGLEWAFVPFAP